MKRILLSAIMLLSIACGLRAQTAPDAAELTKLLKDFLAGAGRNDAAMHERFWADDLIYTASAGRRKGKADILREVREEGLPSRATKPRFTPRKTFASSNTATPPSSPSVWWRRVTRPERRRQRIT